MSLLLHRDPPSYSSNSGISGLSQHTSLIYYTCFCTCISDWLRIKIKQICEWEFLPIGLSRKLKSIQILHTLMYEIENSPPPPPTHTCQTHFSYLCSQNLNFKCGSLPTEVSDWQRKDQWCEERRCHLPSSMLVPWQIFFLKWRSRTDMPAERREICPIVVIARRLCCSATVKLKYQTTSRSFSQLTPSSVLTRTVTSQHSFCDSKVDPRHCLKCQMSVSTLAAWRSAHVDLFQIHSNHRPDNRPPS